VSDQQTTKTIQQNASVVPKSNQTTIEGTNITSRIETIEKL